MLGIFWLEERCGFESEEWGQTQNVSEMMRPHGSIGSQWSGTKIQQRWDEKAPPANRQTAPWGWQHSWHFSSWWCSDQGFQTWFHCCGPWGGGRWWYSTIAQYISSGIQLKKNIRSQSYSKEWDNPLKFQSTSLK